MNAQPWQPIASQGDIDNLMEVFGGFHDSCIKEARITGGGYVSDDFSMGFRNASLHMVMQRQWDGASALELAFSGLRRLDFGMSDQHFPDIFDAALLLRDGLVYWANDAGWTPESTRQYPYTVWVSAEGLRWRILEDALGEGRHYQSPLDDDEADNGPVARKSSGKPL